MKNFIGKRWTVDGYYRYSRVKSAWEYERPYREGKVVWEVDGERITCYIDGQIDHSAPCAFSREDTLLIDFSAFIPHFNRYTEKYLVEERDDGEVWLYDGSSRTRDGVFGVAIKLLAEE